METRYLPNDKAYPRMNTEEMRENFLVEHLFKPGELKLLYADVDRAIVGSAVPTGTALELVGSLQEMRYLQNVEKSALSTLDRVVVSPLMVQTMSLNMAMPCISARVQSRYPLRAKIPISQLNTTS